MINQKEKYVLKKTIKRRLITLLLSIPFGIGFAILYYICNLSLALQIFLTAISWGVVFCIIEVIIYYIKKAIDKRNVNKPKKFDPFAD